MNIYFKKTIIVLALFLITGVLVYKDAQSVYGTESGFEAHDFPMMIGTWRGEDIPYNEENFEQLGVDSTIFRHYIDEASGRAIQLYLAYYKTMDKSDLSHSPLVCYGGQGWGIMDTKTEEITLKDSEKKVQLTRLLVQKRETQNLVLFWYQIREKIYAKKGFQRISLILNKLMGDKQDNIWVRVSTSIPQGGMDQALATETDFISALYPETIKIFSNEKNPL